MVTRKGFNATLEYMYIACLVNYEFLSNGQVCTNTCGHRDHFIFVSEFFERDGWNCPRIKSMTGSGINSEEASDTANQLQQAGYSL